MLLTDAESSVSLHGRPLGTGRPTVSKWPIRQSRDKELGRRSGSGGRARAAGCGAGGERAAGTCVGCAAQPRPAPRGPVAPADPRRRGGGPAACGLALALSAQGGSRGGKGGGESHRPGRNKCRRVCVGGGPVELGGKDRDAAMLVREERRLVPLLHAHTHTRHVPATARFLGSDERGPAAATSSAARPPRAASPRMISTSPPEPAASLPPRPFSPVPSASNLSVSARRTPSRPAAGARLITALCGRQRV